MEINIGINEQDRQEIADGLSKLLADSYTLYLKTHNYHWNVKGPLFNTLHQMLEEQYTELTSIEEEDGEPTAENMIRQLVKGQEAVVRTARGVFAVAEAANDEPGADLLTQRMQVHEKNAFIDETSGMATKRLAAQSVAKTGRGADAKAGYAPWEAHCPGAGVTLEGASNFQGNPAPVKAAGLRFHTLTGNVTFDSTRVEGKIIP